MPHRIYPHGGLERIGPTVWQVQGRLAVPVPRNMTVLRTADNGLVLSSVVAMDEPGMRALEALGTPTLMVIPHRRHQMDAAFYKARYPDLRVLAPNPEAVRDVRVDAGLAELDRSRRAHHRECELDARAGEHADLAETARRLQLRPPEGVSDAKANPEDGRVTMASCRG